jgi:hypothetical protein
MQTESNLLPGSVGREYVGKDGNAERGRSADACTGFKSDPSDIQIAGSASKSMDKAHATMVAASRRSF